MPLFRKKSQSQAERLASWRSESLQRRGAAGDGLAALQGAGAGTIGQAHRLRLDDVTRTGDDVRLTLRRH